MKYAVELQAEETNELANNCSITGTVNGLQIACVIRCSSFNGLSKAKQKQVKQQALIKGFLDRQIKPPKAGADEVEYEPPA